MFTEADASLIAQKYFDIKVQASRLPGEYDVNFHLISEHGLAFILKISHPDEDECIIALQNALLQHIEANKPPFATPCLLSTITHEPFVFHAETKCYVRLFTFVPGRLVANIGEQTQSLWFNLGTQLGYLTVSLKHFQHTAAERYLKWDLPQSLWIAEHLYQLNHADDQACVEFFLQRFAAETAAKLPALRRSVIHGDLNDYNILVTDDTHVSGFIDFGDAVKTATVCELAIALAYVMLNKTDPLAAAASVISGFHTVFPLQEAELAVLFDLICMRLCVSVINSALRKKDHPEDAYLVISEQPAWELLRKLHGISVDRALSCFRTACGYSIHVD